MQLSAVAIVAVGLSFVTALLAIAFMMRWLRNARFTPFVIYRVLLGGGLLYIVYFQPGLI